MHSTKNKWKRANKNLVKLSKSIDGYFPRKLSHRFDNFMLTLPSEFRFLIIKNENTNQYVVYIYNNTYSFLINFSMRGLFFIKVYEDTNTLCVKYLDRDTLFRCNSTKLIQNLRIFSSMFVCKLRVRGRLFRIYKRNKYRDLCYRFGHGHRVNVLTEGFYTKYVRKKRIRMFGYIYKELLDKLHEAKAWFPLNVYTERGIHIINKRWKTKEGKIAKFY